MEACAGVTYIVNISDMKRDKRKKFVELATKRVNRAIRDLRLIGNLSNASAYSYTEEDVRKVVRALQRELEAIRARFGARGGDTDQDFSL